MKIGFARSCVLALTSAAAGLVLSAATPVASAAPNAAAPNAAAPNAAASNPAGARSEYLVKVKKTAVERLKTDNALAFARSGAAQAKDEVLLETDEGDEWHLVRGGVGSELSALARSGEVTVQQNFEYRVIEPEFRLSERPQQNPRLRPPASNVYGPDPLLASLWGMSRIGAPDAWDTTQGSRFTFIANIDTGVDYNHPDLVNNIFLNEREVPDNGIDDDRNGFVDDFVGYDFANDDGNPFDGNGHGTHTTGTHSGQGENSFGVKGVCPDCRFIAVKFLRDSGSGRTADAVRAIRYAVSRGVRILSNSWGGGGYDQALYDAIEYANRRGVLFVAAAGNDGRDNDQTPHYPSSYNLPNVISVASMDRDGGLSWFSNYGVRTVDIVAPGGDVLSTVPGGEFDTYSGTSMATPHVSGALGLIWSREPGLTHLQVKERLLRVYTNREGTAAQRVRSGSLDISLLH